MSSTIHKLMEYWHNQGIDLPAGNTEDQVIEFESRYAVVFPHDLRAYFLQVNGMAIGWPNDRDAEGFSFWPLGQVKTVPEESQSHSYGFFTFPEANSYFVFADYLDWSWAYAIRLSLHETDKTPVVIVGKAESPIEVAKSFSHFVELYLVDSPQLYG